MYTRMRKALDEGRKGKGFTLIELLVVIVIIGILAAIAIPIFLNQRKKASDAGAKSDVRTVATQLESAFTDNNVYVAPTTALPATGTVVIGAGATAETVKLSPGDTLVEVKFNVTGGTGASTAFCARVTSNKGTDPVNGYTWISDNGGLQPVSAPCAAPFTFAAP